MPKDKMAELIAEKQKKAWQNMYSPADLERDEYYRKIDNEREKFKSLMLSLLEEDKEFKKQVKELLG